MALRKRVASKAAAVKTGVAVVKTKVAAAVETRAVAVAKTKAAVVDKAVETDDEILPNHHDFQNHGDLGTSEQQP